MDATRSHRRAWPVVVAVLAVMGLLAGGWNLVGSWLPDGEALPAGVDLRLGPDPAAAARLPLADDGWRLSRSASNPDEQYALRHGTVALEASYVELAEPADADRLWAGLRRLGELSGAAIGAPADGTAPLTEDGLTGTITVVVHPARTSAVVLKELGRPDATATDRAAVQRTVRGVTFGEPA